MDEFSKLVNLPAGADEDVLLRMAIRMMGRGFDGVFDYNHPNKVAEWVRGDNYLFSSIVNIQDEVIKLIRADKRPEAEALLTDYLKGQYINAFMESTRKNWAPGGHEGSQSQEVDEYRLLIKATAAALDAEEAYWKEQNGED